MSSDLDIQALQKRHGFLMWTREVYHGDQYVLMIWGDYFEREGERRKAMMPLAIAHGHYDNGCFALLAMMFSVASWEKVRALYSEDPWRLKPTNEELSLMQD